jgi:3-methyladenine DNA glycosylase AlkC
MTVTAGKYELYNTRDLANNTNNTFIGSFNKIASYMNEDKNFYLHSRAYNNLSELEKVMPSAILDIDHEF